MRHIISILLENEAGALSRVAGLFSARAYNIESLTVAPTEDSSMSRMTLVTSGSAEIIEQITKQLNKLIDVVKLNDLNVSCEQHIEREMMLIKLKAPVSSHDEIMRLSNIFRGNIIDVSDDVYTVELTGTTEKLNAFIAAFDCDSILETVRSGVMGIARGSSSLHL